MIPFAKMHGCGNDFLIFRRTELQDRRMSTAQLERWLRRVCDRHFGIGADGILAYERMPGHSSGIRMIYWNADGSPAEMCGNGARCVARLAVERGEAPSQLQLHTNVGVKQAIVDVRQTELPWVEVDLGPPSWSPMKVPARVEAFSNRSGTDEILARGLTVLERELFVSAVSMGNPHAVVLVKSVQELEEIELKTMGPALCQHEAFPEQANASFALVENNEITLRVWERGAGATLACGTASCASYTVAQRLGKIEGSKSIVHLPGGDVSVRQDSNGSLWLGGPAVIVGEGRLNPELFDY